MSSTDENNYIDYINIGTEKCVVFVRMSKQLLHILKKLPLLHRAIEEAAICGENYRYYAAGILAFSQMLNVLNEATPNDRHLVAHQFLEIAPSEESYRKIWRQLKTKLEKIADSELAKASEKGKYFSELQAMHKNIYTKQ